MTARIEMSSAAAPSLGRYTHRKRHYALEITLAATNPVTRRGVLIFQIADLYAGARICAPL